MSTYRDDAVAAEARVMMLRAEISLLEGRLDTADGEKLQAMLRRRRREVARARRAVARLRHPMWRALPRNWIEIAVSLWFAGAFVTLGMGAAFVITCLLP